MAEFNACLSEQEDEVLAVSAIFGEDFSKRENTDCGTIYEIKIKVNLVGKKVQLCAWLPVDTYDTEDDAEIDNSKEQGVSAATKITFKRSESKQHSCLMISVSNLTPLRLEFSFPNNYPTSSKPLYTLSCLWLDVYNLTHLCDKLDELWEASCGESIIFPWVDWLQNSSLEFLGAYESIALRPYEWDHDDSSKQDPRAVTEFLEPKTCALEILQHDFHMVQQEFRKESHVCEICVDEKEGYLFHFLEECGHKFCVECLLDYCQMHVNDGTVRQLLCPQNKCKTALSPMILRELLSDDDFERWERLLFEQTLDGMIDVLYCPRCGIVVIQDEDEESKLAQCQQCFYSFCTECHMSWHSTQPCGLEEAANDVPTPKTRKRRRKPKANVDSELDTVKTVESTLKHKSYPVMQSFKFLMLQKRLGNYQRCPKCRIMVEKTDGCDMMHCSRCSQKFCWKCGQKIGGYDHFSHCGTPNLDNIQARAREMLANRPVAAAVARMKELAEDNPGLKMTLKVCPRCGQKNMKEHRNNHIKCWSCKLDFCYQCHKQIGSPVWTHFNASSSCEQHSDD